MLTSVICLIKVSVALLLLLLVGYVDQHVNIKQRDFIGLKLTKCT